MYSTWGILFFKLGQPWFRWKRQAPCFSSHRQEGTPAYTPSLDRYQVHFNNKIIDPETIKSPFPKPTGRSSLGNSKSDLRPEMHLLCSIVTHSCLEHPLWLHPLQVPHIPLLRRECPFRERGERGINVCKITHCLHANQLICPCKSALRCMFSFPYWHTAFSWERPVPSMNTHDCD